MRLMFYMQVVAWTMLVISHSKQKVIMIKIIKKIIKFKRKYLLFIFLLLFILISFATYHLFWGKGSFDPEFLASTETQMWQAYYRKDKATLAWLLVKILKRQFGLTNFEAAKTAKLFANAAMQFKYAKNDNYNIALPELSNAYSAVKKYSGLHYNPQEAAKADLAWWVDRRNPAKRNKPEIIGAGIAHLYEVIYGYKHSGFTKAGMLRAKAAYIRDHGQENCDWGKIRTMLLESYKALQQGIDKKDAS